jgi:hypothetical protein
MTYAGTFRSWDLAKDEVIKMISDYKKDTDLKSIYELKIDDRFYLNKLCNGKKLIEISIEYFWKSDVENQVRVTEYTWVLDENNILNKLEI